MKKKLMWSAIFGNLFEHYDTALFGFLSPFLAPLIFPKEDPMTALLLTFAMIPLGMLARPLGALYFGRRGDQFGRRKTLSLSLFGMAVVSTAMALTPTYAQAGIVSPLLFCLGRICQNFFAAGEVMGCGIFLLENAPEKKRDLLSSLYNSTTIAGILCASAMVALIASIDALWAWRLLYLFGAITGIFAYLLRRGSAVEFSERKSFKILWEHKKALLFIASAAGFSYATYSIAIVLMNGFVPLVTSFSKEQMMELNTYLLVLDLVALPFFGWVASKISRMKLMLFSAMGVILFAIPLFMLIPSSSLPMIIAIRICLVLLGVAFAAPFNAWAHELLPTQSRYTIISFGYALGTQTLGGGTAAISLWCYKQTGSVAHAALYWTLLAFISCIAILLSKKYKESFHEEKNLTPRVTASS